MEDLRLAAVLAHALPAADVVLLGAGHEHRIGPGAGGGRVPLAPLRDALAEALGHGTTGPVDELLGVPAAGRRVVLELAPDPRGARSLGGGLFEVRWAGRTTCLFATVLDERDARAAVRAASTFPPDLEGVPVSALGLDPSPRRIAVVADPPTRTTVFGLDRATGADAGVVALVRSAMTAAAAACLVAELDRGRHPEHQRPER